MATRFHPAVAPPSPCGNVDASAGASLDDASELESESAGASSGPASALRAPASEQASQATPDSAERPPSGTPVSGCDAATEEQAIPASAVAAVIVTAGNSRPVVLSRPK